MARTSAGAQLTERHRRAQLQVRAQALRDYTRLWPLWQGDRRSFERLVLAATALTRAYRETSSGLATAYYQAFRQLERPGGSPTPVAAPGLASDQFVAGMVVTGRINVGKAVLAGKAPQAAMQTALTTTAGTVTRFVLDGGRDALVLSSAADRQAAGWARVPSGNACAFCAMLAANGAVYSEDTADFEAHDHCACGAEPQYSDSVPPPAAERYRDLYEQAQREARDADELDRGTSNDPLNAFRRLLNQQ